MWKDVLRHSWVLPHQTLSTAALCRVPGRAHNKEAPCPPSAVANSSDNLKQTLGITRPHSATMFAAWDG